MTLPAEAAPDPGGGLFGWRRWMPRAVFESVLIVFSVFLALALSQWAEDRRTAERVEAARGFFAEEIRGNRDRVRSDFHLPHHERLRARLAQVPGEGPLDAAALANARSPLQTGMHPVRFRDAVWRSVSQSDLLEEMDPREVFMLADIYGQQEDLTVHTRAMLASGASSDLLSADPERVRQAAQQRRLGLGDVVAAEHRLLKLYDEALPRLGRPSGER